MADKYLNLTVLTYFWNKVKVLFNNKVNNTDIASDTTLGLVRTNSNDHITVDSNGVLYVEGRLGQSHTTTGMYAPATIEPNSVGNGSLLITEASGTKLGNKSLAVSTGSNLTLKTTASAGATQYVVANNYQNRIICAGAVGGVVALNEASSDTTANIISVQINGTNFTPDSSANDSTNNIIITVDESINPNSSTSSIRIYANEGSGYSNLFVGQQVGGNGGASVVVGQKVFSNSGNACAMVGADIYNAGNGNALFGRQHISKKNRWFMSGTGHDNSSGRSESGAAIGQWSDIQSDTLFAIGNGSSHTVRSNAFEVLNDGRVKANGTPSESDDLVNKNYVDNALSGKQNTLVSGTNIKTINNQSLLGSGNITIKSGSDYTAGDGIDITNDVISNTKPMNYEITGSVPSATPLNADQLQGHPASYFQKLLTAGNGIDISNDVISSLWNVDLLWTNSSPTTSIDTLTVPVSLTNYRYVMIEFCQSVSNVNYRTTMITAKANMTIIQAWYKMRRRLVDISNTSISFQKCYEYGAYAGSETEAAGQIIPFRIYGIK